MRARDAPSSLVPSDGVHYAHPGVLRGTRRVRLPPAPGRLPPGLLGYHFPAAARPVLACQSSVVLLETQQGAFRVRLPVCHRLLSGPPRQASAAERRPRASVPW